MAQQFPKPLDWEVDEISINAWVEDLETVVNSAGMEKFALLGLSQGSPIIGIKGDKLRREWSFR